MAIRKKKIRRRRPRSRGVNPPVPRVVKPRVNPLQNAITSGLAAADASEAAAEALRPNTLVGIGTDTPETALAAGDHEFTFELNEGVTTRYFQASKEDDANWVVVSAEINGFPFVKGKPVPLSIFCEMLNQEERATPLQGRKWRSAVPGKIKLRNISGAAAKLRNIACAVIDHECKPGLKKSAPAPGFLTHDAIRRRVRIVRRRRVVTR